VTAYLYRITRVFSVLSLGVLLFGVILANTHHKISHPWATASMTLFVVAAVLLVLIMRDQHKAIDAMKVEAAQGRRSPLPRRAMPRRQWTPRRPGTSPWWSGADRLDGRGGQPDLARDPGPDGLEFLAGRNS
jgi:hypothetical protein